MFSSNTLRSSNMFSSKPQNGARSNAYGSNTFSPTQGNAFGTKPKSKWVPSKPCSTGLACTRGDCHFSHPIGWTGGQTTASTSAFQFGSNTTAAASSTAKKTAPFGKNAFTAAPTSTFATSSLFSPAKVAGERGWGRAGPRKANTPTFGLGKKQPSKSQPTWSGFKPSVTVQQGQQGQQGQPAAAVVGTQSVQFTPQQVNDAAVNHLFQSISSHPTYADKSHEELRWEDISGQATGGGGTTQSTPQAQGGFKHLTGTGNDRFKPQQGGFNPAVAFTQPKPQQGGFNAFTQPKSQHSGFKPQQGGFKPSVAFTQPKPQPQQGGF